MKRGQRLNSSYPFLLSPSFSPRAWRPKPSGLPSAPVITWICTRWKKWKDEVCPNIKSRVEKETSIRLTGSLPGPGRGQVGKS